MYQKYVRIEFLPGKYSAFEHSHSPETPVELPLPDELDQDLSQVYTWLIEFRGRVV